jgi:succinate-semialdehyde dehydrogenase/glutarate-semialdehyde dehydrogenase
MATKAKTQSSNGSPQSLKSFNPRTGETIREIAAIAPAEVRDVVEQARKVAPEWGAIDPEGRVRILRNIRSRIKEKTDEIVDVVASETGKPRAEALSHEVLTPLLQLAYLEHLAPKVLKRKRVAPVIGPLLGFKSRMEFRPFGVVGCITPWNFPITNSFLALASPLFAGNTVVIKPSEVTPGCGEMLRELLEPLPSGVATVIQGGGDVGAALVDAPCDKISFVGSPVTGRKICGAAAEHLTPVVMELGGKDSAIICSDADLDLTTSGIVWGAFANAGQICASIERAYVVDSVADEFQERLLAKLSKLEQGEDIGSLTFARQLDIVSDQVEDAVAKGATVLAGGTGAGKKNENGTLWYAPTVITDVTSDMSVLKNETFGPILTLIRVRDEEEALQRANTDGVNLTASVWTKDSKKRERLVAGLRAGSITHNFHLESVGGTWGTWGGVGESGYGRLNGELGLLEFTVPTHVSYSAMPKMKRSFWYPYDSGSERLTRSLIDFLGSKEAPQKLGAIKGVMKDFMKIAKSRM